MSRYARIHAILIGAITLILISLAVFHRIYATTTGSGIATICRIEAFILLFLLSSVLVSGVLLVISVFKKNRKQVVVYLLASLTPPLALILTISVDPYLLYVT